MRKWSLLGVSFVLMLLAACGGGGNPPANACPNPAVFDNANCKFDDGSTKFGP